MAIGWNKIQHCTKRCSIEKNSIYLKHLAYNYCHSHKWRVEWIPSSANSSFERLHIVVFLSTSGAKENALTASHQRLNPVFIRGTQRGFPHKNIENTFWVIQSTCRSLEMNSILSGALKLILYLFSYPTRRVESFRNYKGFGIIFPKIIVNVCSGTLCQLFRLK